MKKYPPPKRERCSRYPPPRQRKILYNLLGSFIYMSLKKNDEFIPKGSFDQKQVPPIIKLPPLCSQIEWNQLGDEKIP